jgi:enoyl-CoA hydratase/carnithine racemase
MAAVERNLAEGISTITLNRPERLNAINDALVDDLDRCLAEAEADADTAVIVLTGAGRAFCAGDDLKEFEGQARSPAVARDFIDRIHATCRRIVMGSKPVVAAVRGWAAGGGLEWTLNADLVVMGEGTRCFFPEISLGFMVGGGASQILPRLVGPHRARAIILLGERFTAAEALAMGLAHKVVPDEAVLDEALALARRLRDLPQGPVRRLKRVMALAAQADFDTVLRLEAEAIVEGFLDPATPALVAAAKPRQN